MFLEKVFSGKGILKISSKFTAEHPNLQENTHACNFFSPWVFSCKFAVYFQDTFSKNTSDGLLLSIIQNHDMLSEKL